MINNRERASYAVLELAAIFGTEEQTVEAINHLQEMIDQAERRGWDRAVNLVADRLDENDYPETAKVIRALEYEEKL